MGSREPSEHSRVLLVCYAPALLSLSLFFSFLLSLFFRCLQCSARVSVRSSFMPPSLYPTRFLRVFPFSHFVSSLVVSLFPLSFSFSCMRALLFFLLHPFAARFFLFAPFVLFAPALYLFFLCARARARVRPACSLIQKRRKLFYTHGHRPAALLTLVNALQLCVAYLHRR